MKSPLPRRLSFLPAVALLLLLRPALAQTSVVVTPAYVNELAEELRTNSPAFLAASARARASDLNAEAARIWEDPMLWMGTQIADQAMKADEGNLIYGVRQKLPLFGKPQAMRRAAQAEAAVGHAGADLALQTQRRDLAQALFQAALAQRIAEVGEQDRAWLETIVSSADARYRAGQVALTYLVEVQNELSRRTNALATEHARLCNELQNLNRLLNRPANSAWPRLQLPELGPPVAFTPELLRLSLAYEPRTRMISQQVHAADAMVDVSKRARYPEIGLDFEGRNYSGNGDFRQAMILVNFTLPLGNGPKYRRDMMRDQNRARAARFDLADQQLALRQELNSLTTSIDAARREGVLYRDEILPRTERALAAAQSDWESGRAMFREILDAHRMLLDGRLMLARATSEQWRMLSDLALCCGLGDLEALQMLGGEESSTKEKKP